MNKSLTAVVLMGAVMLACAEPVAITKTNKWSTIEGGVVKMNGVDRGIVSVGAELGIAKPVKITMKMRRRASSEVHPGHFGVELSGGDEFKGHFYTHDGANFIASLHQHGSKISDKGTRGQKDWFPAKPDAPWVVVELYVQPKLTEIHVGGQPQGMVNANLLPLKALGLYGYNHDIEVRDLKSEPLPEAEPISSDPNPSFQASFDNDLGGLTAKGAVAPVRAAKVERVPGVSGQAVRIAASGKTASPISAHPSWKPVNGTLESRGNSKGAFSLTVPDLTEATVSLKVKRLSGMETNQHFGIVLGGTNGSITFSTGGSNLMYRLEANKKTLVQKSLGAINLAAGNEDSPWQSFVFQWSTNTIEVRVNGTSIGSVPHALPPISTISYSSYKLDSALDDLEVRSAAFNLKENFTTFVNALDPPTLEYDADGLFADHGTVMFWMKSDWDGRFTGNIPTYPMLSGLDEAGREKLGIFMYYWISFKLGRTAGLNGEEMKRDSRSSWYRGDWNHIAMVWSDGDWCKAYLNGLPYQQPFGFNGKVFANLDVKAVRRLTVGTSVRPAESAAAFDELKIYKRPLSNGEVYDEYRKFMPVDLLIDRAVIEAGKADEVVLLAAPGGYYMRPMPAERPLMTGKVDLQARVVSEDGQVVAEKAFSLNLTAPTELKIPVANLPAGNYRLTCTVGTVQRSFELVAYQPLAAMPAVDDDIELGEVIFSKDIKDGKILEAGGVTLVKSPIGEYLEGGGRKEHRFSFEVPFPGKYQDGRAVMLEIEWPDDKPRSMGLYMYPESKGANHRDRLGGGVQSGIEYPLTGKMQKTRYLFHPALSNYLFEARAMIGKFPAAIAGFRVYAIKNARLPRLPVNTPGTLPGRRFGHNDEDETFDQNLTWDYKGNTAQVTTERLLDYLDYTGQNAWQYPFIRYNGYSFPMEGAMHTLYPYRTDAYRYMVEALNRRGKITIANIDLFTLPELKMLPDQTPEQVRKGWTLIKFNDPPVQPGNQFTRPNHANPDVRAMIARHVRETAQRFARVPGFDGINLTTHSIGFYGSLDYGYDDYTVNLFSKESGVAVTAKTGADRHAFLTQEPQLGKWVKWRDRQSVELYRLIRSEMDTIKPGLKLYLQVQVAPLPESMAVYDELRTIKGVYLVALRSCTGHRWQLHWGKPAEGLNDLLFDPLVSAKLMNGDLGFVNSYPAYFESFNGSLKNDVYGSYFQNADVKPFGRYFLKELAFAVAAMDAQRILIGAQPLGTWGRDAETREFARAYCALPALPFESAPGVRDPVTVRYLNTDKGSYLYAVSMLWSEAESTLAFSSRTRITDLSTGNVIRNGRIRLKPFELRAFYSADPRVKVTAVTTDVPENVTEYYRDRLDKTQQAIIRLTAAKIDCGAAEQTLARMRERMKSGQFAELHRLLFSIPVSEVMDKADNFERFAEQAAMIGRGHYAVDCGANGFYRARNGTLFFPDQPFGKGDYGYVGAYRNVVRNTDGVKADDPELFMTEAYSMDAYKFKVKPGTYKVRLYLKAGYRKGFKPDGFVFNVDIQGKRVLDRFDVVTACSSDFSQVAIKEFNNVEVAGDVLEITFTNDAKYDPSVKLVNAIEVIRQ